MRDLVVVDRQLAELGPAPEPKQVSALLERMLGSDRSLERLNELLDGFGDMTPLPAPRPAPLRDPLAPSQRPPSLRPPARPSAAVPTGALAGPLAGIDQARSVPRPDSSPVVVPRAPNPPGVRGSLPPRIVSPLSPAQSDSLKTATPWPPVSSMPAAARPRDTLVDAASAPALASASSIDEHELDAETAALFGITTPPKAAASEPATAAGEQQATAVPAGQDGGFASAVGEPSAGTEEGLSARSPRSTLQFPSMNPAAANAQTAAQTAAQEAEAAQTRLSTRQLLDQALDPREFPSSHPPRARSLPPPLPAQAQSPAPADPQDGFEMLIDDSAEEDIMEIDDMELEEID